MKYLIFSFFLILTSCSTTFGPGGKMFIPNEPPKTNDNFDILCAEGDNGHRTYLNASLMTITHSYYIVSSPKFSNLIKSIKKEKCYMEQTTDKELYYLNDTKFYTAKCTFNKKVKFYEYNLVKRYEDINYYKFQRLLDGKTWLLPKNCSIYEQSAIIPYKQIKNNNP